MNARIVAVAAVVTSLLAGETVAHAGTVDSGHGFSVNWQYVSNPWAARQIAACYDNNWLYALNYDGNLYFSGDGGGSWSWVETMPESGSRADSSIACILETSQYSNSTFVYFNTHSKQLFTMPAYYEENLGLTFRSNESMCQAVGGPEPIFALNNDSNIWTNSNNGVGGWIHRGYDSAALRVGGFAGTREFAVLFTGEVVYNDNNGSQTSWLDIPLGSGAGNPGAYNAYDMSVTVSPYGATTSTIIYVLDSSFNLWKGGVSETNCTNGIDDDNNGYADWQDPACHAMCTGYSGASCNSSTICCNGACSYGHCP